MQQIISVENGTSGARAHHAAPRAHGPCDRHAVQFYDSQDFLNDTVAAYLAEGFAAGEPMVLIATQARLDAVRWRLAGRGFDADGAHQRGDMILLDARETLGGFMRDGRPDPERFEATVGRVVCRSQQSPAGKPVRAYGEMVDLLWQDGNAEGAIQLEALWNALADRCSLSLLCAYSMQNFARETDAEGFHRVCEQHGRVLPAEGYDDGDPELRARQVTRLQQRALALEEELRARQALERELSEARDARVRIEKARVELEAKAEQATQAESKFLAMVSHELRTPLNVIIGYQDLLAQEVGGPITDVQRRYVVRIRVAAQELLGLIDQILSHTRIEPGLPEAQPPE